MSKKLSVLIPMYNESGVAESKAVILEKHFGKLFPDGDFEIVFCDDGSTDGCGENPDIRHLPHTKVVGYKDNRGKGAAIRYGIALCEGEYIVCTDCDLAYGCDAMENMYKKLVTTDSDLVVGSRNLDRDGYDGYTVMRKFMSKLYIKVISLIAGFRYTDSQCGIKAYRADAAREIFGRCTVNGFAYDLEVLILADTLGYKVSEMPVKIIDHVQSRSKVKPLKDSIGMIRDVFRIKKLHKDEK